MKYRKQIILLLAFIPLFLFSQVRIKGTSEIRVLEESAVRVTGNSEVASGAKLSVLGDYTSSGNLANNGGVSNVIIESDVSQTGSLIVQGSATGGNITVERYLSPSTWHFLAASVNNVNSGDFYFNGNPEVYACSFDEPNSYWPYISGINESMPLGVGYKVWVAEAKRAVTAEMQGSIRTSDLNLNLTTSATGWNLIGNPFTSEINTNNGNWGSNTDGNFYVWDISYNGGDYRVWNGSAGDLTDGIIPISQSFFVFAESAGSYTIPKDAQTHGGDAFYKNAKSYNFIRLQLDVQGAGNTLFIGFPENGTSGIDYKGDAYKIYSSAEKPQLYGVQQGEKLCILADAPLYEEERVIPVYIDQWLNGNYTLSIDDKGAQNFDVYLEDLQEGEMIHISQSKSYQFQGNAGDVKERFLLHFTKKASVIDESINSRKMYQVYAIGKSIYIKPLNEESSENDLIQIYNINGQKVYENRLKLNKQHRIPTNLTASCYFVHIKSKGINSVEKVIVN